MTTDLETLHQILEDVWAVSPDEPDDQAGPDDIDAWDSISHMDMVGRISDEFGVDLDIDDVTRMETVGLIKQILSQNGIKL